MKNYRSTSWSWRAAALLLETIFDGGFLDNAAKIR